MKKRTELEILLKETKVLHDLYFNNLDKLNEMIVVEYDAKNIQSVLPTEECLFEKKCSLSVLDEAMGRYGYHREINDHYAADFIE